MIALAILAAFQADTLHMTMQVSWDSIASAYLGVEVMYALTDWPVVLAGSGNAIGVETRDAVKEYEVIAIAGMEREVCMKTRHKYIPPPPDVEPGPPFSIEITWCYAKDYPACKRKTKLYSPTVCTRYMP